jgi:phosphohistidine swiveling domain-containing protein
MGIEEAIKTALKEQAMNEGKAEGKAEVAEAMLEDGFSEEKIIQLLKIDKAFLEAVRKKKS